MIRASRLSADRYSAKRHTAATMPLSLSQRISKTLPDHLRQLLTEALHEAKDDKAIRIDNVEDTADLIFALVEGAYYYLSMVSDKSENEHRLEVYKKTVLAILDLK